MDRLQLVEHASAHYSPRTRLNAATANLTIAFAVDFDSAGERLTKKAAGEKYLAVSLDTTPLEAARMILRKCQKTDCEILNIAGNGMHTLAKHGWTQDQINRYIYDVMGFLVNHLDIKMVISGGQTGVDHAGLVAAIAHGLAACGTYPKGYKTRGEDGIDRVNERIDLGGLIFAQAIAVNGAIKRDNFLKPPRWLT